MDNRENLGDIPTNVMLLENGETVKENISLLTFNVLRRFKKLFNIT
jgi:hypothetical protein